MRRAEPRTAGRRRARGQALVLGLVVVVLLAAGMLTTYELSRAIVEKVRLQDAADATAYSLATLEARSLNFVAFANRAQIANYVQMMEAQSLLSSATFGQSVTGILRDVLGAEAPALVGIDEAASGYLDYLDEVVPRYVAAQTTRNYLLFATSLAAVLATAAQVADGGREVALANDPAVRFGAAFDLARAANVAAYLGAFDWRGLPPAASDADRAARERAVAELTNASRYGSGLAAMVTGRPLGAFVLQALGPALEVVPALGAVADGIARATFTGTTKLLRRHGAALPSVGDTARDDTDPAARTDVLAAKDEVGGSLLAGLPGGAGLPLPRGAVVSSPSRSVHCRYAGTLAVRCDPEGGRHDWRGLFGLRGGIAPFLASRGAAADGGSGEPDVWVVLAKNRAGARGPADAWALARAQAYYHRPGAWQESPNLFNPFWAARLAPADVRAVRAGGDAALADELARLLADTLPALVH